MSEHSSTNQQKAEPISPAADVSGEPATQTTGSPHGQQGRPDSPVPRSNQPGAARRQPGELGEAPEDAAEDDLVTGANRTREAVSPPEPPVPSPGDAAGVSVPSVQAARGSSEETGEVSGVRTSANAPPGRPEGEVDTRR